jgi:hypothetical protein
MRPHPIKRRVWAGATDVVVVDANSLAAGLGTSNGTTKAYPALLPSLAPLSGTGTTVQNRSESGRSIVTLGTAPSTLQGTRAAAVAAMAPGKRNLLITHEVVNELTQNGNNVGTTMNALWQFLTDIRADATAAGKQMQVLLLTCEIGRTSALAEPALLARIEAVKECNMRIRAEYRKYAEFLGDMAWEHPWRAIEDGGDYSAAAFAAVNAALPIWTRNDGGPLDYLHYGDYGQTYRAAIIARYLRQVV